MSRDRRASEILRRHQEKMRLRANARFLGHMVIQGKTKMGHSYACVEPIYTPGKDLTLKELKFLQMLISGAPVLI